MATQTLKDSSYRIIGYIETRSDGVQIIKDANYHIRGYYEPSQNVTKDQNYRIVGHGNLLSSLLG